MLSLQTIHPVSWIREKIIFLDIKQLPSIMGYGNVESNAVVLGSTYFVNNDKNWFCLQSLVLVLRISKYICLVWIRSTENLPTHPRTSFSINDCWSNKYDAHKSIFFKAWTKNLEEILDQSKKSIQAKKSGHPTCNLATTFQRHAVEENTYVRFGYGPQTIF